MVGNECQPFAARSSLDSGRCDRTWRIPTVTGPTKNGSKGSIWPVCQASGERLLVAHLRRLRDVSHRRKADIATADCRIRGERTSKTRLFDGRFAPTAAGQSARPQPIIGFYAREPPGRARPRIFSVLKCSSKTLNVEKFIGSAKRSITSPRDCAPSRMMSSCAMLVDAAFNACALRSWPVTRSN
jgi:hypothetical protein